jgi:hypothetical protein
MPRTTELETVGVFRSTAVPRGSSQRSFPPFQSFLWPTVGNPAQSQLLELAPQASGPPFLGSALLRSPHLAPMLALGQI